jgi:hypothetical protein
MNNFMYDDVNWKVFGIVNDGTISNHLKVQKDNRSKLHGFLHYTLGIMNYTSVNGPIHYEIKELEESYSIHIVWGSTKLKSQTTLDYINALKNKEQPDTGNSEWRIAIAHYLKLVFANCYNLRYSIDKGLGKDYVANLYTEIKISDLYTDPNSIDEPNKEFDNEPKEFMVPIELIAEAINENIQEAIKHFGTNHQLLFNILEPLAGKEFLADFLIGSTYYVYLDMPHKAYDYLKRASVLMSDTKLPFAPTLLDFLGNIEMTIKKNPNRAEEAFMKGMMLGNEKAFLKLAYVYLQQAITDKKEVALDLVQISENVLHYDEDLQSQISGYHIAASVYVWNGCFEKAEKAHHHFLSNVEWCTKNSNMVESYLVFSIAKNDENFLSNLITDYPIVLNHFALIINTWQYAIINPHDERFHVNMVAIINLINNTKRRYGFK